MGELISEGYKALLQRTHAESPGWGSGAARRLDSMESVIRNLGCEISILDYGCGKGSLAPAIIARFPQATVAEYDPGIPGKDNLPTPADLVVCLDVLEHVEEPTAVLAHLRSLTLREAFIIIGLGPAIKILPDGRNAHLHQWPPDHWARLIENAGFMIVYSAGTQKHWMFHART